MLHERQGACVPSPSLSRALTAFDFFAVRSDSVVELTSTRRGTQSEGLFEEEESRFLPVVFSEYNVVVLKSHDCLIMVTGVGSYDFIFLTKFVEIYMSLFKEVLKFPILEVGT